MENFIVSARKYRPATFASVVGQRHITSTLKNAIERGQLAHAYLFCGPRGVGKTTCARIFAKAINCLNPQAGEACNECESCRSFNEGRSLNVHELDAASNNSVDDIRNLIDQVRIIPQQGSYSVFVIDEVHMLSAAAFNAFLKTLEEPPRHAIFILATTEKHKIIPTILSRCQIYDFNRIKVEDGVEYLRYIATKEGVEADDEALNLIAHKADGGMRDALSMFDKAVSFCGAKLNYKDVAATLNVLDYDTYFKATELLIAGHYVDALVLFDNVLSRGFSPQVFIAGLNAHFRDLLMAKGPAVGLVEFTGTLVERYKAQAAQCSEAFLFGAISLLTEADGKIRQSSNQRLLVELGLMKIAGLGQKKNGEVADDAIVVPTYATAYPLPDLEPAAQPARVEAARVEAARVEVQHTESQQPATPKPQPTEPRVQESGPKVQAVEPRGQAVEQGVQVAEPKPQTAEPRVQTADLKPQPQRPTARSTRSSISLSNLLGGDAKTATELAAEAAASKQEITIDPHCEEKISIAKERIVDHLMQERRRFVEPFQSMTVEGNVVRLTVASKDLYNEIMRDKSEWQRFLAAESGAQGLIEIEVIVNEAIRVARPITLEDRLRHLVGRNERLTEMIERLALDAE
ncbi:MAG: DNA polymerase III subunit gamma/tau [Alistipes sp.]|nr:DNA polymerase III subunit gamma/tau [Alistipes sp.]